MGHTIRADSNTHPSDTPSRLSLDHAQTPPLVTTVIVDDHPIFRHGIRVSLEKEFSVRIVAECSSAREALRAVRECHPALVILDISLPGGLDGIELTKCILSEAPSTAILVLSVHDEALYALRAIAAGAKGYLMKDRSLSDFREAVRSVSRGEHALSTMITQRLVEKAAGIRSEKKNNHPQTLSDRELEVLFQIGNGLSSEAIGRMLNLSLKTIETHRANLRRKLALKGGQELLRYAVAWRQNESLKDDSRPNSWDPAKNYSQQNGIQTSHRRQVFLIKQSELLSVSRKQKV